MRINCFTHCLFSNEMNLKNPRATDRGTQFNAVARNIETDCLRRNLGIFNTTENDLRRITKIAYVKILLEQC